MRIVIITQDEPFYLKNSLSYLLDIIPEHSKVVGCIVSDVSPFGKKESFFSKAKKTLNIFGLEFFLFYSIKYLNSKLLTDNSVFRLLKKKNIPVIKLHENINKYSSISKIKSYKPDLLVSILGNQIFKKPIIKLAPKGCINLHTALLPKYRGLMPTFWVLKNNEKKTGVSVFLVDEGIDSGPIIVQSEVEIKDMNQQQLIKYTKKIGMEAIAKSIDIIYKDNFEYIENDDSKQSYYSFPTKQDVLDFKKAGKKFF